MDSWLTIISFALGLVILGTFIYASVVSIMEREKRASILMAVTGIILASPFIILSFIEFPYRDHLLVILMAVSLLLIILLFAPIRLKKNIYKNRDSRIDERIIMFSRRLLKEGTERYNSYYKEFPQHLKPDLLFRKKPGLMSKESKYYDPISFAAAEASFDAVAAFHPMVEGKAADIKIPIDPKQMSHFVKNFPLENGAVSSGIAKMEEHHWYSKVGRGPDYGKEVIPNHLYGIAFTVEMDKAMMDTAPHGPTLMESGRQYLESGRIAIQLAIQIRALGYEARAHIDGNYRVVCPLVARDAGLGEIGRMGLLMTPELGPRVRIAVVTTNMPLIADHAIPDPSMISFCGNCKKCARMCPGGAISYSGMELIDGVKRWQIDQEKCFTLWCVAGTDCGICMKVCPYSHPNNSLHKFIRFGIRNNPLFRRIALPLDDFYYGFKPNPRPAPAWLSNK